MANEGRERARRLVREFAAALLFFFTGCGFILLAAVGPVYLGGAFNGTQVGWIGMGLVVVAVYTTLGVSLPRLLQGQRDFDSRGHERGEDGGDGDDA